MEYKTGNLKFIDDGSRIVVYRNGEKWEVPQGNKFLRILLKDIELLQKDIEFFKNRQEINKIITQELTRLNDERIKEILTRTRII